MNKAKYNELFAAFEEAPMKEFLELLFEGVPVELKDSDQWIWVRVERDPASGDVKEYYCTKDSYGKQSLSRLLSSFLF